MRIHLFIHQLLKQKSSNIKEITKDLIIVGSYLLTKRINLQILTIRGATVPIIRGASPRPEGW